MKEQIDLVDATPLKRMYLSIIADYDLNKAICELIDNALDLWVKNHRESHLTIDILLDQAQQRIEVRDNAGGLDKSELAYIVGPGHTGNLETDRTIGIFGVGTKRAVVALSQDIRIRTRKQRNETYQIELDDAWIRENDDWMLPVYRIDSIPEGSTFIELVKLRKNLTDVIIKDLVTHLGATYSRFMRNHKIKITVNTADLEPIKFENWAFPPNYEPRIYFGTVEAQDGKTVRVKAVAGLTMESSPSGGEYGVYFYCNNRLIARGLKTYDVGFTKGIAGKPHADISLARIIVFMSGEARLMPWNSSKSDIDPSHPIFDSLRGWLLHVVKDYTSISRRLSKYKGGWPAHVFRYKTGQFVKVRIPSFPSANTSYLPPLYEPKLQFKNIVAKNNKKIFQNKIWTVGLCESVVTVDWILKQKFEQRNRIALILLDSTLEIAFKEYLVNESGVIYSDRKLLDLFADRTQVHNEVKTLIKISNDKWKSIKHYYQMRCQLVHRRASVSISDREIHDFRRIVEYVLSKLFKLKFKN